MFLLIQNKITERMVTVNTGTTELDFGVEVISRQSPSLFLLHKMVRQRLTHFMQILEIFKIQKFLEKLCQDPHFLVIIIKMTRNLKMSIFGP